MLQHPFVVLFIAVGLFAAASACLCRVYVSARQHVHALGASRAESASRRNVHLAILSGMSCMLGSRFSIQAVFDSFTETCLEYFRCHRVSLMIHNELSGEVVVRSVSGKASREMIGTRQKIEAGVAGWAARHRQSLLLNSKVDEKRYPGLTMRNPDTASAMVVPIVAENELIGILSVSSYFASRQFHDSDLKECEMISDTIASCVFRSPLRHLFEEEKRRIGPHNVARTEDDSALPRLPSPLRTGRKP
jgi:transcriptional regulator with GAF, ATPase, and Fis domain